MTNWILILFLTWKNLFRFWYELPKVLEEEGGRRLVVFDRQRQLGPGVPQHVDGLVVTCRRQRCVIYCNKKTR